MKQPLFFETVCFLIDWYIIPHYPIGTGVKRFHILSLFFLCVFFFLCAGTSLGQQADPTSLAIVSQAIQDIEQGNTDAALDPLEDIFEEDPAWFSEEHFSLAYWLGQAYFVDGHIEDAREVWTIGTNALQAAERFDPRLETALLAATFDHEWSEDYATSTTRYLRILENLDSTIDLAQLPDLIPYLQALTFILPDQVKTDTGLHTTDTIEEYSWTSYTSTTLVTWWRSRDSAPATRINEMLQEHLERIAYAKKYYYSDEGFDDRGMIYIRLGEPSDTTMVQFDKTAFRNKVLDRSLTINESDFPNNEFWYYKHIDQTAHYIFHDKSGVFRLGGVNNLIPVSIRSGLGASNRGQAKARALIRTMEEIYRQLSLYHEDFTFRYQDIASFSSMLDEAEIAAETAGLLEREDDQVDSESDETLRDLLANSRGPDFSETGLPGSSFNPNRPDLFVQSAMASDKAAEEVQLASRDEYVPQIRSSVFDELAPLPLLIRSARFLDPDGTTRTEIYWAAPTGSLALEEDALDELFSDGYTSDDYLLVVSTVQKAPDYTERVVNHNRKLLKNIGNGEEISISDQTTIVRGDSGLYHIAVQWDQLVALLDETGTPREIGPHVKANVYRQDSLQALISDGSMLEMSDLKPMIIPDLTTDSELTEDILSTAIPYPSIRIKQDIPIILYFEVYHLGFNSKDITRYTIEYDIEKTSGAGLRLGRRQQANTSFQSTQEGSERTAAEQLVIDLSDWRGTGDIEIKVTITDEVTKQQVSRSLSYTLTKEL